MASWLPDDLPNLTVNNHKETSRATPIYNCIGWAAGDDRRWWWPQPGCYWPRDIAREETIDAFVAAFETKGYELCEDPFFEEGCEKVALYVNRSGCPAHAALQLPNGHWTSKLGLFEDIEHSTLEAVNCEEYGSAQWFLKRRRP